MALVGCRECGKEVSSTATRCPKCGVKNPAPGKWMGLIGILIVLIAPVAGIIFYLNSKYG